MLHALLTNAGDLAEKTREVEAGEASLYALLGFMIVFIGIAFLIFVVWLVGKFMVKMNGAQAPKKEEPAVKSTPESLAKVESDELTEETVAIITAALMAYYQQTSNPKCEFTVKRIKRI